MSQIIIALCEVVKMSQLDVFPVFLMTQKVEITVNVNLLNENLNNFQHLGYMPTT